MFVNDSLCERWLINEHFNQLKLLMLGFAIVQDKEKVKILFFRGWNELFFLSYDFI